jgi:hypothetical protein
MDRAAYSGHPGMNKSLALAGIQMPPNSFLIMVIYRTDLSTDLAFPLNTLNLGNPNIYSVLIHVQLNSLAKPPATPGRVEKAML